MPPVAGRWSLTLREPSMAELRATQMTLSSRHFVTSKRSRPSSMKIMDLCEEGDLSITHHQASNLDCHLQPLSLTQATRYWPCRDSLQRSSCSCISPGTIRCWSPSPPFRPPPPRPGRPPRRRCESRGVVVTAVTEVQPHDVHAILHQLVERSRRARLRADLATRMLRGGGSEARMLARGKPRNAYQRSHKHWGDERRPQQAKRGGSESAVASLDSRTRHCPQGTPDAFFERTPHSRYPHRLYSLGKRGKETHRTDRLGLPQASLCRRTRVSVDVCVYASFPTSIQVATPSVLDGSVVASAKSCCKCDWTLSLSNTMPLLGCRSITRFR
eukprot:scaffold452_cov235-Pinguiococcus_pyrenoidosus.AAC.15